MLIYLQIRILSKKSPKNEQMTLIFNNDVALATVRN